MQKQDGIQLSSADISPVLTGSNNPVLNISSSQRTGKLFAQIQIIRWESETEWQKFSISLGKKPVLNLNPTTAIEWNNSLLILVFKL